MASFEPLRQYGFGPLTRTEDDRYVIEARPAQPVPACPHCGARDAVGFGRREREVADVPLHGRPVRLAVHARRFRCGACARTFYESLPEIDDRRRMTTRLMRWIVSEARRRTGVEIAAHTGLAEGTVRGVLQDHAG